MNQTNWNVPFVPTGQLKTTGIEFLDVAFDEDSNRTRKGYSAANLAVTRHIALNLIKTEKTAKVGVKTKRLMTGWDNNYLLKIIGLI